MMAQQALPVGLQCFHVEPFFPPFSPVQNRTGYFSASFTHLRRSALQPFLAVHCIRPCSALHPPLQCTASVPARTCNRPRTYLHPSSHVLASVLARTCGEKMPFVESLPPCFSPLFRSPSRLSWTGFHRGNHRVRWRGLSV